MNSARVLLIIGILVLLAPFAGLPYSWLRFLLPVLGLLIVFTAFRLRSRRLSLKVPQNLPHDEQKII